MAQVLKRVPYRFSYKICLNIYSTLTIAYLPLLKIISTTMHKTNKYKNIITPPSHLYTAFSIYSTNAFPNLSPPCTLGSTLAT